MSSRSVAFKKHLQALEDMADGQTVVMPKTLAAAFVQLMGNAQLVGALLTGHTFLTRKQKDALEKMKGNLLLLVELSGKGIKPKEDEEAARYKEALEAIAKNASSLGDCLTIAKNALGMAIHGREDAIKEADRIGAGAGPDRRY